METTRGEEQEKVLSLNRKYHRHDYEQQDNFLVCKLCGKKILNLMETKNDGLLIGKKSDGANYSVRTDRRRYFFPNEWNLFIGKIKDKTHRLFFITALHTGGRVMEILNLKHEDIKIQDVSGTIEFKTVKQRKAKRNFYATGKTRSFFVASNFIKEYKSFIRGKTINPKSYIFLDNSKLPQGYDLLNNDQKKKHYAYKVVAYSSLFKRKMKSTGIKDWYNFSLHNIRKTYGMWMRALLVTSEGDLCYRLGHDLDTYIAHYGSSLIFTDSDKRNIASIMGEVK